jgi:hypothetical protein
MSVLVPCPGCSRHVRSAEAACPFCGKDIPVGLASKAVPATRKRMDRFATFTFAAALAVAGSGAACSSGGDERSVEQQQQQQDDSEGELRKKKDAGAKDSGKDSGCRPTDDPGAIIAMYGMPPIQPVDNRPPCEEDAGSVHAMYGIPPVEDDDAGGFHAMYGMPAPDPDNDDAGGFHALYGMPPHN